MPDYNRGKIYKIYNTITEDIYIGATTRLLCERMRDHKYTSNIIKKGTIKLYKYFKEYGVEHFFIELLEIYNCSNKEELTAKEAHYIRELKPSLNTRIEGRTPKQYYADNTNKIHEQKRVYYYNNWDMLKEKRILKYLDNKDTFKERCKTYYDANTSKIFAQNKIYYLRNKDTINAKNRQNYADKKNDTV